MDTQNLELQKRMSFDDLVKHGIENGANIVNGMPWSWRINGKTITHENDRCYIVEAVTGFENFTPDCTLIANEAGLVIFKSFDYDTHAPQGCPM